MTRGSSGIANYSASIAPASISSLERLIPSELESSDITGAETYRLHVERYRFAAKFVQPGRVLDCACGVGYGSRILAEAGDQTQSVTGVDINDAAINYAKATYGGERLDFVCADGSLFGSEPFETVVSFETIEHVPDAEALVGNLTRLLKPGGTLIASVPVTPSVDVNPFHLHDFTQNSFRRMFLSRGLTLHDSILQRQPYQPLRIMSGKETRLSDMRKNLFGYYLTHPRAAAKRLYSTAVDGFCNKYLICAWRHEAYWSQGHPRQDAPVRGSEVVGKNQHSDDRPSNRNAQAQP